MKKIVFILPNLNGHGSERVAINYIRQLDKVKYAITLLTFDFTTDLAGIIPSHVALINLDTKRIRYSFLQLFKRLRIISPHIVFTTHFTVAVLLFFVKPFLSRFYHIARIPNTLSAEKKYGVTNHLTHFLYAVAIKNADVVIAQTEDMKSDLLKMLKINNPIIVQHNPIDTEYINAMLINSISPFSENQINAVASGRLCFQKGFDILIKAVPSILRKYPEFVLHILGSDDGEGEMLREMINDLNLTENVKLLGFVGNPYSYYKYCSLFILSSRWEGFPNVFIENYYLNSPIVATKCIPLIEELLDNGKNGFICNVDNIEALIEAIVNVLKLKRANILNPPYCGGKLIDIIEAFTSR
jgi:glycosyltransferase involved in cell wall biosynthesis